MDWMQLYKEEQKKRGKKNIGQIKSVTEGFKSCYPHMLFYENII